MQLWQQKKTSRILNKILSKSFKNKKKTQEKPFEKLKFQFRKRKFQNKNEFCEKIKKFFLIFQKFEIQKILALNKKMTLLLNNRWRCAR